MQVPRQAPGCVARAATRIKQAHAKLSCNGPRAALVAGMWLLGSGTTAAAQSTIEHAQALFDQLPLSLPAAAYDELAYGITPPAKQEPSLPRWIAGGNHLVPGTLERAAYLEMRKSPDTYMVVELSGDTGKLAKAWTSDGATQKNHASGRPHWWVSLPRMHREEETHQWRADIIPPFVLLSPPEAAERNQAHGTIDPVDSAAALVRTTLSAAATLIGPEETPETIEFKFGEGRNLFFNGASDTLRAASVPDPLARATIFLSRGDGPSRTLLTWLWHSCDMPKTAILALADLAPAEDWQSTFAPAGDFCQLQFVSPAMDRRTSRLRSMP